MKRDPFGWKPMDSKKLMIGLFICSVPAFLFLWFVMGETRDRVVACIAIPLCWLWGIFGYVKERRDNKRALQKKKDYLSGDYFRDPAWREAYLQYRQQHPYETCHPKGMRYDMMQRYRRKSEPVTFMVMAGFLLFSTIVGMCYRFQPLFLAGIPLFGYFFWIHFSEFIAWPVRKWLKTAKDDPDFPAYENSYTHGRILSYQAQGVVNGMNLGASHIILYDKKEVHTVELSAAEGMTREIVRLKEYVNDTYSDSRYLHYAVLHVRTAQGEFRLRTQLDEYQVEMAVEEFSRLKGMQPPETAVREKCTNENVF